MRLVVVVVLTGDFTNVFAHARKWVRQIMGSHVPVDMNPWPCACAHGPKKKTSAHPVNEL